MGQACAGAKPPRSASGAVGAAKRPHQHRLGSMQPLEPYKDHSPLVASTAYVHPKAVVIGDVELGEGVSVWPCAVLRGDDGPIRVGAESSIQDGSILHMTKGDGPDAVGAKCLVGARVVVGHNVILHGCTIEDDCLIGMGATILDGAVIGQGSVVGAASLVTTNKTIPPGSLLYGNPAKVMRPCGDKEREMIDHGWREYVERGAEYRERDGQILS